MRYALVLGLTLLCFGCGDDAATGGGDGGGSDADGNVNWNCNCWSVAEDAGAGSRTNEAITHCSETDPTEMLSDRAAAASDRIGRIGGCDPCDETTTECVPED